MRGGRGKRKRKETDRGKRYKKTGERKGREVDRDRQPETEINRRADRVIENERERYRRITQMEAMN